MESVTESTEQTVIEYSVNELNTIREKIENMNKFNQVEVLRILNTHDSNMLNENKYGVHVNLSEVNPEVIYKLKTYMGYVDTQENTLNELEKQQEEFKKTYFAKDNKG